MAEHETKYVQFPLFLIQGIFADKNTVIDKILDYGIYGYSKRFKYTLNNVARQLIYDHYNDKLGTALKKSIKALNSDIIGFNDDYRGFDTNGKVFEPTDEIAELLAAFEANDSFKKMTIEHYQMHLALQSLGVSANSEHILKQGKQIEVEIPANEPMPMLSTNLLFDYLKNEKNEFEIAQLLAYMAIRSIIGKSQYGKTNKQHIVARMFGFSSIKAMPSELTPAIKQLVCKYNLRYHIDKLLQQLELNWHVETYSNYMRGLYVGIGISKEMLAIAAETKKQKNKMAKLRNDKAEARNKALRMIEQHLNKGEQLNK